MRLRFLTAVILASGLSGLALAQEPIRMPSTPAAPGSPGTATPQPHGQPPTATPIRPQGSAPLLPPPGGQRQPGTVPNSTPDQPIPQLDQQIRRNSEGLGGQRKQD